MKKNKKLFFVLFLILFISIGYAFLTSNLSLDGLATIKKSKWDVHFENLVDDNIGSSLNVPAKISDDKLSVDFEVTLNNPGDEYYFYVDVVNNSTFDVMLKDYLVTGLTTEQEEYISTSITYSDGIEINKTNNKYDLLEENAKDTFKISVKYRDDIELSDIPEEEIDFSLTFNTTYEQADENAVERQHNEDVKPPTIKFVPKNEVKGNNNWYKSLSVTTKLLDSSPIKSVKYCVTTDDECTPNTPVEIENNSFTYQLLNNAGFQTICIEATDNLDNVCTNCSKEEYKVDGEDPTMTSVSVTPDDNTMTVEIVGTDDLSGIAFYYFSKDGGESYVKSKNPNYTFTELDDGNYIIMGYIEDNAGNISLTSTTTTTVRHKGLCEKNNISNLADCIIAQETGNPNIEEARESIETKGTPDFNKTSPSYIFKEKESSGTSTYRAYLTSANIGRGYTLNPVTGFYDLTNIKLLAFEDIDVSTGDYYICNNMISTSFCNLLFKVTDISEPILDSDGNINGYVITKKELAADVVSYDTSEVGLYSTSDNYGTSYYYRGSVGGNYVKFANKYWKIIRVNGDGSLRLIYYGSNIPNNNPFGNVFYNLENSDPAYEGYMYDDSDFNKKLKISETATFNNFTKTDSYVFSKNYEFNSETGYFVLTGSEEEKTIISGIWEKDHQNLLDNNYIYTCANESNECRVLIKLLNYKDSQSAQVQYLSYGSTSYENATKNSFNSNVKKKIDEWYEKNILNIKNSNGVSFSSYLKDSIFCNDRSFSATTAGDGYNLSPSTHYGAFYRNILNKKPSLLCKQKNDSFTVLDEIGNTSLKYPIGLITIDEIAMAGAKEAYANPYFYLNFGYRLMTMSPSHFSGTNKRAYIMYLSATGGLYYWAQVTEALNYNPVINVDPTKFTFTGTGTAEDPFVIE